MKKGFLKSVCSCIALAALSVTAGYSQEAYTKSFEKTYSNKNYLKLTHRNGPLEIRRSNDGQLKVMATISLRAKSEADANAVFSHFDFGTDELGDRLEISSSFETRRWQSNNGVIRIEFEDRTKVNDIKDLKIELIAFVPPLEVLKASNRYGLIKIDEGSAKDLFIQLYDGKLETQNILGELTLDMKYSKASIGDFVQVRICEADEDNLYGHINAGSVIPLA